MDWNSEAEQALQNVPGFVRGMAKKAVEEEAHKRGATHITPELVQEVKEKYITSIFGDKKAAPKKGGPAAKEEQQGERSSTPRKVAIIRCDIVSETCPGVACMKSWNNRKIHFSDYGPDDELVAMMTCGGCSGRRVSRLVETLKKYGLDVVHLSSCMMLEGDYPKCPHKDEIKETILAKGIQVVEGTHH